MSTYGRSVNVVAHTGSRPRLVWPDVAKGACILLVVLHHVVTKHYDLVVPAQLAWAAFGWETVSHALKPVRMPLFFVVSGFFAASSLTRPWPRVARRAWSPAYLYVVWLTVMFGVFAVETELPMNRTRTLEEYALDLVIASTGLWFLYALAAYLLVARLTVRLPAPVVVAAAAALALATSAMPIEEANRVSVLTHLVYFLLGARCRPLVLGVAGWRAPGLVPGLTLLFLLATVALRHAGLPRGVDLLVLSAVGVPWGIQLAVQATRLQRTSAALAWLGRRTLPVYVLHVAVLGVVHHLHPGYPEATPDTLVVLVHPLVVSAVVVAVSLGLHALLVRGGLAVLFEAPFGSGSGHLRAQDPLAQRPVDASRHDELEGAREGAGRDLLQLVERPLHLGPAVGGLAGIDERLPHAGDEQVDVQDGHPVGVPAQPSQQLQRLGGPQPQGGHRGLSRGE